jgi:hypothetical protein
VRVLLGYVDITAYGRGHLTDDKRRKRCIYTQGQNPGETVQGQNRAAVAPGSPATVPIN